jgi:hypothetical protein
LVSAATAKRLITASNSFKLAFADVAKLNFNNGLLGIIDDIDDDNDDESDEEVEVEVEVESVEESAPIGRGRVRVGLVTVAGIPIVPLGIGKGWRPSKSKNRIFH